MSALPFEWLFERNRLRRSEEYRDISRIEKTITAEKTPNRRAAMIPWSFFYRLMVY